MGSVSENNYSVVRDKVYPSKKRVLAAIARRQKDDLKLNRKWNYSIVFVSSCKSDNGYYRHFTVGYVDRIGVFIKGVRREIFYDTPIRY